MRVLYIDDDPGIGRLVQRRLERAGFVVSLAAGSTQGLDLARSGTFDAIALDHYMPGRDGLEILADLHALPAAPPVIFVTGAEEPRIAVAALKAGAADYVVKDAQGAFIDMMGAAIRHAIAQRRMQAAQEDAERQLVESHARLERLTAQQSILLREVNHRVANSLQLISSLIAMQARRVPDAAARDMLSQAAARVDAVSLIHRRLYTSDDIQIVAMDQYLKGLIEEFRRTLDTDDGHSLRVEADPVTLATDRAVSVGLIVNELVMNALKYAYPDTRSGAVRIILRHDAADCVRLSVEDDGVGYPGSGEPARGSGLGATIVAAMTKNLHGTLDLDRAHQGTRFVLTIPA